MPSPFDPDHVFNNADGFAQAFDEAWLRHERIDPSHGLETQEKLRLILDQLREHPFFSAEPDRARQVAEFRIRLLGL
jgi:hypothetical protein